MGDVGNFDISGKPCALIFKFDGDIEKLLNDAARRCADDKIVLLIRYDDKYLDMLVPAYVNALVRKREGSMKANTIEKETLLFIAHTLNIREAIERAGMKRGTCILFSNDEETAKDFASVEKLVITKEISISLDFDSSKYVADLGTGD